MKKCHKTITSREERRQIPNILKRKGKQNRKEKRKKKKLNE